MDSHIINSKLSILDFFAPSPQLNIRGQPKLFTKFGAIMGFLSLLAIGVLSIYFF
jgi:hypothetical protein